MANENTQRRGIYLPKKLDDWFSKKADKTGVRVNTLILEALNEYKENQSGVLSKADKDFEKNVRKIIHNVIQEKVIGSHQ